MEPSLWGRFRGRKQWRALGVYIVGYPSPKQVLSTSYQVALVHLSSECGWEQVPRQEAMASAAASRQAETDVATAKTLVRADPSTLNPEP